MVKTIETIIYTVFALAGAALIIYFVINALPDMKPVPVELPNDDRGLFTSCDNETTVCTAQGDQTRCEVLVTAILCHQACPCP